MIEVTEVDVRQTLAGIRELSGFGGAVVWGVLRAGGPRVAVAEIRRIGGRVSALRALKKRGDRLASSIIESL